MHFISHRQNSTYHGISYTSRGALAGTSGRSISRAISRSLDGVVAK